MKRPALQNKHVVVYEWLLRPEKFSGLSRNGTDMTWERILFRPAKTQPSRKLGNNAIWFNWPFAVERSRGTKMELEGFSVHSLLYGWSSCFHGQAPIATPGSFLLVLLLQWNNVLLRRYFTVHRCIPLEETIRICLDKLYSLPDPLMYNFEDIIKVCYQKESLTLFLMANIMRKLMV